MLTIYCGAVELSSTVQLHNNYEILWKLWMTKHFVPVYRCDVLWNGEHIQCPFVFARNLKKFSIDVFVVVLGT